MYDYFDLNRYFGVNISINPYTLFAQNEWTWYSKGVLCMIPANKARVFTSSAHVNLVENWCKEYFRVLSVFLTDNS